MRVSIFYTKHNKISLSLGDVKRDLEMYLTLKEPKEDSDFSSKPLSDKISELLQTVYDAGKIGTPFQIEVR